MKGTTKAQATAVIADAMQRAGITKYNVAFNPSSKADVDTSGEPVTVTVTASMANVAWLSTEFFSESRSSAHVFFRQMSTPVMAETKTATVCFSTTTPWTACFVTKL